VYLTYKNIAVEMRKNMDDNKMKSTKNRKKEDGTFHAKHIKHDPQAESARTVFGLRDNDPQNIDMKTNRD
jgi:hypothetical protein